ncbi:MAG: energy transducer TonB [Bacteroidales bacterium]
MQQLNKFFSKLGYSYYHLLAFITNGNKRFVDKKLIFGALLVGISSQYACKHKSQDANDLHTDKDSLKKSVGATCYESIAVEINDTSNFQTKIQQSNKRTSKVITVSSCYDVTVSPSPPKDGGCYAVVMPNNTNEDSLAPYTIVEQMPEFPAGDDSLKMFLKRTIKYPELARGNNVEGVVYVNFIVERDGSITKPRILRGIANGCDEETIRVVKLMPKWIPGKQNGKDVRVQYNLPIKFMLDDEKK